MKKYVIDSSVAVKWYIPEPHSDRAVALLEGAEKGVYHLWAPDLIYSEMGNVLWKKCLREEIGDEDVRKIIGAIMEAFPANIVRSRPLLPAAFEIAYGCRRTLYDSLYIALAIAKKGVFITADERLVNAFQHTSFNSFVKLLQHFDKENSTDI